MWGSTQLEQQEDSTIKATEVMIGKYAGDNGIAFWHGRVL